MTAVMWICAYFIIAPFVAVFVGKFIAYGTGSDLEQD